YLPVRPPSDLEQSWTVDPAAGAERAPAPTASGEGEQVRVSGRLHFVPDAPGAELLVGVALPAPTPEGSVGKPVAVAIEAGAPGCCAGSRTAARCSTTRAGRGAASRTSSRWPQVPRARSPAARWIWRRAR